MLIAAQLSALFLGEDPSTPGRSGIKLLSESHCSMRKLRFGILCAGLASGAQGVGEGLAPKSMGPFQLWPPDQWSQHHWELAQCSGPHPRPTE